MDPYTPTRVAIIGGGISGLAAANRLHELAPQCKITLFEASDQLGGVLKTTRRDGFLFEWGADNFITNVPWATDLCQRIGFDDQLVQTDSRFRTAFVVRKGRLLKIPEGFMIMAPTKIWPMITTGILSPLGKLRLTCEYFVRKSSNGGDESLAGFVERRLGRETYERLVQPLVGGIYTGDPRRLSLMATMPRFRELEQKFGSMMGGVLKSAKTKQQNGKGSGARYSMFVAPRDGMQSLVNAIAERLPADCVRLSSAVNEIGPVDGGGWNVKIGEQYQRFDGVIVATSSDVTARLMRNVDAAAADILGQIPHSVCSIVSLCYERSQIAHPMDGFGFVVPQIENRRILSGSFSSIKYPGRAPDGSVLIRVFVGGTQQAELADLDEDKLVQVASEELRELLRIEGAPTNSHVTRHAGLMPQYYVGHLDRMKELRARTDRLRGFFLAGNAYNGVGLPQCIRSGESAAAELVESIG